MPLGRHGIFHSDSFGTQGHGRRRVTRGGREPRGAQKVHERGTRGAPEGHKKCTRGAREVHL